MVEYKLSPNFALSEFTQSQYALRMGINNTPSPNVLGHLKVTADGMEKVRELLGKPITISSGYRCPTLNKAIGGASTSDHVLGFATDFTCRQYGTPEQVTKAIMESGIKYDQLICEGYWTHISFSPKMRQETLRALFDSRGKVSYRQFS